MLSKETQFWHKLSKQAVFEQNPARLKIITDEINRVLEDKVARLQHRKTGRHNAEQVTDAKQRTVAGVV
jgi:hypothetical protein